MAIVGGLDVHRRQITFDYLDTETGQVRRGRIAPADRQLLRRWLMSVTGRPAAFAVEACTGWRFVVEELCRAGIQAHLAEPAETAAARGPKQRAKTDRADARQLRELLAAGRLPESWIAPEQVLEIRGLLQLFKDLRDEHTGWVQRIHAVLFHHGVAAAVGDLLGGDSRQRLQAGTGLSPAGHQAVLAALRVVDMLKAELGAAAQADRHVRSPTTGLQSVAGTVRRRAGDRRGDLGRTRRLPPLLRLPQGSPPHRPGCDRLLLRRQTRARPTVPAGLSTAALGTVRGGLSGRPHPGT